MSDIPVLEMSIYKAVTNNATMVENIKTFATANGWTASTWQVDKQWASTGGGNYGWTTGTETFLQLTSSGFGSQTLDARLRYTPSTNTVYVGGANQQTISTTSSTHPVDQNRWNSGSLYYVPTNGSTVPVQWIFGNSKFILNICRYSYTRIIYFAFGSIDLYDTTGTGGNFVGTWQSGTGTTYLWDTTSNSSTFTPPFDYFSNTIYNAGAVSSNSTNCYVDFCWPLSVTQIMKGTSSNNNNVWGGYLSQMLVCNEFSEYRPMLRQKIYWKDVDNVWYPLGQMFVPRLNTTNIGIGEELVVNSERYLVFPGRQLDIEPGGFAVRIE